MAAVTAIFDNNIDNLFNCFTAAGTATRSTYSLDGETWTATTYTSRVVITDLAYGNGVVVFLGGTTNTADMIYTGTHPTIIPTIRTAVATGTASVSWQAIAFGNDTFVAVSGGAASTAVLTSPNSVVWTKNTGLTSADWRCIAYGDGVFVTLSYGSNLARYSADGITWDNGSGIPTGKWKSITYDASLGRFVAVSVMPLKVYAANATSLAFAVVNSRITRALGDFTTDTFFVGCKFTVTGTALNDGTYTLKTLGTTTIDVNEALQAEAANVNAVITPIEGSAYSDDGMTWSIGVPSAYLEPSKWISVASSGAGKFVAISQTATNEIAAYSEDGISWTRTILPVKSTWGCVDYGNSRFVALDQSAGRVAYSSNNGVTWTLGPTIGAYAWSVVRWTPFPFHSGDTLTIDRGATITVNTDQHATFATIAITKGKLLVKNITGDAIRFVTARTSGSTLQAITPADGTGTIAVEGDWIEIGEGDGTASQELLVPYTDYVSCLWVETGVATDEYEIWLNVSGAYGGTLKQYADGLLDVSTGQRGKFFTQTPNPVQDNYITATGIVTPGLFTISLEDATGDIYQGASITGLGIPASTVIEQVEDGGSGAWNIIINQQPTAYAPATAIPVKIFNPYSAQFTNEVVFGDGVNGNVLTDGVRVRIPNIMLSSDTPANLHTASQLIGMSFVMTAGGNLSLDTCLLDEVYPNLNQTQSLTFNNVGLHIRPLLTEVYDLNVESLGMGMPAVRRYNLTNVWYGRDIRDTLINSWIMNYITGAVINDVAMVLQSPNAITAATITAPTGMLNISNSDSIAVSNVRMYSLNTIRAYQCGLAFPGPVTNSTFTNIEFYGGPMMSSQFSSNNTFTNLTNSETMFSFSHNYTAGTRVAYDPNTDADMVSGTKYYFKSRTYFTRDRAAYTESRVYSATPFKGSTYFPDYVTAYVNAPQSVTFGWTHRTPMYTADTSPLLNANAKNFLEIYRGPNAGFAKSLATKVAGFNVAPSISIPTVVTWATSARTLTLIGLSISASGGRTMTFDQGDKTIVCSSGSFIADGFVTGDKIAVTGTVNNNRTYTASTVAADTITCTEITLEDEVASETAVLKTNKIVSSSGSFITDGYAVGDKLRIRGSASSANNATFTISNVIALIINVTETITTQTVYSGDLSIVAKYDPTPKLYLTATARTLKFDGISMTSADARTLTFGGTVADAAYAPTMTASLGRTLQFTKATSTITANSGDFRVTTGDRFVVGDKIYITGTSSNNTMPGNYFTTTAVTQYTLVLTAASDLLVDEGPITVGTISAMRTTITCSSGSFSTDGFIVGDRVFVAGTVSNNTTGGNYLAITTLAATMLTCVGDLVFPEGPLGTAAGATLTTNRLTCSSGSFVTDGYAPGDIIEVAASDDAGNNKTFTVIYVAAAGTVMNFIETVVTHAAENTLATLTVKTMPIPKVVYLNASPNREIAFQKSVAQAAAVTRIFTFNSVTKTITATGTAPGNFLTEGFMIGDKIVVTNTTSNNRFTLTVVTVTATVLTTSTATELQYDEVSTTATLTANRIKATTGSFVTDGWAIGDTVTVVGTASNDGIYSINNVVALALCIAGTVVVETLSYRTGCVITANKVLARQTIYGAGARTFAVAAAARTITLVGGSMLQDGYIVGDKVLVNGMSTTAGTTSDGNHIYTISGLSALVLTFLEAPTPTTYTFVGNPVAWVHTGHRPTFTTTAATINLSWSTLANTLSFTSSTPATNAWDYAATAYNFKANDRIFITNQKWNNGIFTINRLLTKTITASAGRTLQWTTADKKITQAGAGVINFDTEGYIAGDKILVAGTTNNNGLFTISVVGTTTITVLEALVNEGPLNVTANMSGSYITVTEPVIPDTTLYNATAGTTCTVYGYHNPQKITVTASASRTLTFSHIGKSITASSGNFLLGGYAYGDCIQIANTTDALNDGYFTISAVTALVIYVNELLYGSAPTALVYSSLVTISAPDIAESTDYYYVMRKYDSTGVYNDSSEIYVKSTPQEIQHNMALQGTAFTNAKIATLVFTAARTMTFAAATKTITAGGASPGSFITDTYTIGDRIFVAGTASNNGWLHITAVTATILTVQQALTDEGALSTTGSISNIYWQNLKFPILTASAVRTITFNAAKTITLAGTTPGSFITDGYATGDRLVVLGSVSNNSTFTIKTVDSATQITVYEAVATEATLSATATIANTVMTVTAAARVSPFISPSATQTAEALVLTSLVDNATLTQAVPMAINNAYTFSVWVCTQPTIVKLATLTASAVRTLTFNAAKTITVAGTSPGSFVYDGHQIGDSILVAGTTANNGWFTIADVTDTVITVNEAIVTEATYSATVTIINYFNDTLSIDGQISLGTAVQTFTATAQWQKVSVTFTATANLHLAVIQIDTMKRALCAIGAMINVGSLAVPYLLSTTLPTYNNNKVRDISLLRSWCRGYGEAASNSGVEIQLAAANTSEIWSEIYCGTTSNFVPSQKNKVLDTWPSTGYTMIFNQASQYNTVDNFDQTGIAAPVNYALAYFAATSSGNKIKNLTYNLGGGMMLAAAGLASFNTQSNDTAFYNWNIRNWRNYATTPASTNPMIFGGTAAALNAASGLTVENLIFNNSDFPIQNGMLNCVIKGMNGGNVKPLNSALLNTMPVTPTYVLGGGATNYDSIATTTPTVYTTVYDTIFNELYFTTTTGALSIVFNASAKAVKPYVITGGAAFSNSGRLYFKSAEDSIEYTWPHTIIGVSGFRNLPLLLNGVDLGNTASLLEGLLVEYKIDTGSGYPVDWTTANATNLSAESVSATTGFSLKIKITAKYGMKYAAKVKSFVLHETIRGILSQATAVVDADFNLTNQGTLWLSSVVGKFTPGEVLVKDSNGEQRATNVANTATGSTVFATFPAESFTSYIDGLQIYTTVDQTALYPPERQTLSLTGLKTNSEVRIYTAGTTTELAGIENSGVAFDYEYLYSAGTYVDIVILHLDWDYYKIESYLLPALGASIPVAQIIDRVYSNP